MARWCWFFVAAFVILTFLFNVFTGSNGGGALAVSYLTTSVNDTDVTFHVASTTDFPVPTGGLPQYGFIDNECFSYTGQTGTTFTGITRGISDPQSAVITTATAHVGSANPAIAAQVLSPAMALERGMINANDTTVSTTFGPYSSFSVSPTTLLNFPKFITWDYPFFNTGPSVWIKYLLLYPISAGFMFAFIYAMLILAMGIFAKFT